MKSSTDRGGQNENDFTSAYMPVTSIPLKLRVIFLQTRMLYRGGGEEIFRNMNGLVTIHCIIF